MVFRGLSLVCWVVCVAMMFAPLQAEDVMSSSGGPPIPGVCVLNRQAVFEVSKVGQDVAAQFRQMHDAAQKAINDEQAKLNNEAKALEGKKSTLTDDQYQAQLKTLVGELRDLRLDAAQKSQYLEAARQEAVKKIAERAQPFIAEVYQRDRCSLLLSRDAVLAGNPGMDVTVDVVKGLDGAITAMALDLSEHK